MTITWDSVYVPSADQAGLAEHLRESLRSADYTLFDPFGLMPGKTYTTAVRLFVAPAVEGWTRIIGSVPGWLIEALSRISPALYTGLDDETAIIQTYAAGKQTPPIETLAPYLRQSTTLATLHQALTAPDLPSQSTNSSTIFNHLPDTNLKGRATPQQAQKMFDRLSKNLMNKVGAGDAAEDAEALLQGPAWGSTGGRRLYALMDCLTVPQPWQQPDFITLRDAYQLHRRLQRKPDARLYPGDEETMAQVPHALDFVPVYGGRNS